MIFLDFESFNCDKFWHKDLRTKIQEAIMHVE